MPQDADMHKADDALLACMVVAQRREENGGGMNDRELPLIELPLALERT